MPLTTQIPKNLPQFTPYSIIGRNTDYPTTDPNWGSGAVESTDFTTPIFETVGTAAQKLTGSEVLGKVAEIGSSFFNPSSLIKKTPTALGMVAGAKNSGVLQKRINEADAMLKGGMSPKEVFDKTNLYRGPVDDKWRTWFDDKDAKLIDSAFSERPTLDKTKTMYSLSDTNPKKLSDVLSHPELYKRFPWLKDISVVKHNGSADGAFDVTNGILEISPRTDKNDIVSIILHEIQHSLQQKHGLTGGSSPSMFPTNGLRNYKNTGGEAEARATEAMHLNSRRRAFRGPLEPPENSYFLSTGLNLPAKDSNFPLDYYDVPLADLIKQPY